MKQGLHANKDFYRTFKDAKSDAKELQALLVVHHDLEKNSKMKS